MTPFFCRAKYSCLQITKYVVLRRCIVLNKLQLKIRWIHLPPSTFPVYLIVLFCHISSNAYRGLYLPHQNVLLDEPRHICVWYMRHIKCYLQDVIIFVSLWFQAIPGILPICNNFLDSLKWNLFINPLLIAFYTSFLTLCDICSDSIVTVTLAEGYKSIICMADLFIWMIHMFDTPVWFYLSCGRDCDNILCWPCHTFQIYFMYLTVVIFYWICPTLYWITPLIWIPIEG